MPDTKKDTYISDSPITDPSQDRFKRWLFAQRITQTIVNRSDPSSIVIGIYGAWGDGKTTVLNFIEKELNNYGNVICIRFNPWRFSNEIELLRNFFETLADALGKSIETATENIGNLLKKYGSGILSCFSLTVGGVFNVSPGPGIEKLGNTLSSVKLDDLRNRIERALSEAKKRVVILIDDIDRLDKIEIQTIFKIVKLSADFKYIAYILAFDDEMVAAALKEKYSSAEKESGRSFLEKIIQVPLHLPMVDSVSLRQLCFHCVDEALHDAQIEWCENEAREFVEHFTRGLEIRLKTPRMCKRFANAIAFSLPILNSEVNHVDLMLIEGIRVFYPKLFEIIRDNPGTFLNDRPRINEEKIKKRNLELITQAFTGLVEEEQESAKELLISLFPYMCWFFNGHHFGVTDENVWYENKRISSQYYFKRYFSYAIPEGDIPDQIIESFIQQTKKESLDNVISNITKIVDNKNVDTFILKLRGKERKLAPQIAHKLAIAIARNGSIFPKREDDAPYTTPFAQAGLLVYHLIKKQSNDDCFELAKIVVKEGQPIIFAFECFNWIRIVNKKEEIK